MATSEPVVISYLKLPPEEQPFFRLKEIFEVIRDKLEQSTFALAEAQNFKKPELFPPEIKSLMRSLREFASTQCLNVIEVIRTMHEFSGTIMQFLDALPITTSDPTPKIIEIARYASRTSAARWEEAEKEMKEFSDEVITTLEKLRVVLDKDKHHRSAATVFTETNSQAVNELLGVVKEACTILRKISGYLRDTERDIQVEKFRGLEVPLREIETTRGRWDALSKSMKTLDHTAFKTIRGAISRGPDVEYARLMGDFWRELGPGSVATPSRTSSNPGPKAIFGVNASGAARPQPSSPPTQHKPSPVPSLLRRLPPFFRSKQPTC